jgi:hypothetical protein
MNLNTRSRPRRGVFGQQERRRVERTVRMTAVAFARWLRRADQPPSAAAVRLGLAPGTLRGWNRRWQNDGMTIRIRGRPERRARRDERQSILALFGLPGPRLGLPTLLDLFPDVARGELIDLQRRYRNAYRRRNAILLHTLRWTTPGAVWAMDFATPLHPIEGHYQRLLVVRDLASGYQLMALPVLGESSGFGNRHSAQPVRGIRSAVGDHFGQWVRIHGPSDAQVPHTARGVAAVLTRGHTGVQWQHRSRDQINENPHPL